MDLTWIIVEPIVFDVCINFSYHFDAAKVYIVYLRTSTNIFSFIHKNFLKSVFNKISMKEIPRRKIAVTSSLNKFLWLSWERGWGKGEGVTPPAPTPFKQ
jgi:hypothetical protein